MLFDHTYIEYYFKSRHSPNLDINNQLAIPIGIEEYNPLLATLIRLNEIYGKYHECKVYMKNAYYSI